MQYQKDYFKAVKENLPIPQQPDVIGKYIMDLTNRLSTRYNFKNYTYIDVMISEAIENLCKAVVKYDPTKCNSSIFNYFTTIAWHAFQFRIIEEEKQHYTKHRHYQFTYRLSELEGNVDVDWREDRKNGDDLSNNEYSNRVIEEYEKKHINKQTSSSKYKKKSVKKVVKSPPKGVEKLMVKKKKKKRVRKSHKTLTF